MTAPDTTLVVRETKGSQKIARICAWIYKIALRCSQRVAEPGNNPLAAWLRFTSGAFRILPILLLQAPGA